MAELQEFQLDGHGDAPDECYERCQPEKYGQACGLYALSQLLEQGIVPRRGSIVLTCPGFDPSGCQAKVECEFFNEDGAAMPVSTITPNPDIIAQFIGRE